MPVRFGPGPQLVARPKVRANVSPYRSGQDEEHQANYEQEPRSAEKCLFLQPYSLRNSPAAEQFYDRTCELDQGFPFISPNTDLLDQMAMPSVNSSSSFTIATGPLLPHVITSRPPVALSHGVSSKCLRLNLLVGDCTHELRHPLNSRGDCDHAGSPTRLCGILADLAAKAGIRKPSIHHHFPVKEDLGVAIVRAYTERLSERLHEIDAKNGNAMERVLAYGRLYREALAEGHGCLCGVLASGIAVLPESL
jgi:hypothetical protein